jgi:DNA-binding MarR family transcriptional regulator
MQMADGGETEAAVAVDRAAHLLKLASKASARALQVRLARHGVSYGHWTLLRILWKEDGLSVTELARRANVAKPAAVTAISGMEREGYAVRQQRDGNLKSVYVHLTAKGRALEPKLVPLAIEVNDIALRGFTDAQAHRLREALVRIMRNLENEIS